jgi:hypothetical protein
MGRSANDGAVCDEKRLLICCARTKMTASSEAQIRELTARRLDWDYILAEAAENSIGPLLDRNLRAVAPDAVTPAAMESLKNASRANTVRCLFLTAELHKIVELFRSNGILAIPYKGPVLAEQAYGDVTLRNFEDLDFILAQRDMPKAHELILGLGYRAKYPWILSAEAMESLVPGEYNYRDDARRAMVELHTELTLRHFPVVPDLAEFMGRLATVVVGGKEVQTFAPEDLLTALCIHGSKDFWERLSWVVDISELVQRSSHLNWEKAFQIAESLRAERMLHLGLALAVDLFDAPLPEEIRTRVRGDDVANSVAREVEARLVSREWPRFNTRERFRFRRRMVRGALGGWRYSMRLAVIPAEEDWKMVRLPGPLAPLYVALRPLRLLYKYGWTGKGHQDESP